MLMKIANSFADHFIKTCSPLTEQGSSNLSVLYNESRSKYIGTPHSREYEFDVELIDKIIRDMKRGKAAGLDGLTAEHLMNCHPILPSLLAKLFNLCMRIGCVPDKFGRSYTIPLLKCSNVNKSITVDDFRGISISPVISKVFEHCILGRFSEFFVTRDNQFGFKKSVGCMHAIYSARKIVDYYVNNGSTVNLCVLYISKAFDKMNHHGLFLKLMSKSIPVNLLSVLEFWFSNCLTFVKWMGVFSKGFQLNCGIRQGGVLSPYLFALYIDDINHTVAVSRLGCHIGSLCTSIIMFADDLLLLAPSVSALQKLLYLCESDLNFYDLAINPNKSYCIRIGPRYNFECANLCTKSGNEIHWVSEIRYLGVYLQAAKRFKGGFDHAKRAFFRTFNAIYGKVGSKATEDVILHLIYSKCLPSLLYGIESLPTVKADIRSLEFSYNRVLFKIFKTNNIDYITEYCFLFNIKKLSDLIVIRKERFLVRYSSNENNIVCRVFADIALADLSRVS